MAQTFRPLARLIGVRTIVAPHELKAARLAFLCNFLLLGSYYILRPVRDTMATVFGVDALQTLFTGTFLITLVCAPVFAWVVSKVKLTRLLPGVFWFLLLNLLIFYMLFRLAPQDRWLAAAFYWWLSAVNLFLISIFWTFMADLFSASQATRLFAFIAAGGSLGAIAGPIITASLARTIGISGLLLVAAVGFLAVTLFVHLLMREKIKLHDLSDAQKTTLDHKLPGDPLRGFVLLLKSPFLMGQAAYMLLMTWVATIFYFLQTDLIAKAFPIVENRAIAFADVDLFVNICSAAILVFGLGRFLQRFGITASLLLTPAIMGVACLAIAVIPGFLLIQAARATQRISQYAVARPSREVLFTVADQQSKYKAKNVIDTAVYRFGDLSAAWIQAGLRAAGFGLSAVMVLGIVVSAAWGIVAIVIGRRYEVLVGPRADNAVIVAAE